MAGGLRQHLGWRRLVLAVCLLGGAMALNGCWLLTGPGCGDPDTEDPIVRIPDGTFSPAALVWDFEPAAGYEEQAFPRGAIGPWPNQGAGGEGGEGGLPSTSTRDVIPSASVQVDREAGVVIRRYVDEKGRQVEEHYRITRVP